jgi:hypothetical protein
LNPAALLNVLIISKSLLMETSGSSKYRIISATSRDSLTSCFPIYISFISFSRLITLAKISSTILNKRRESWHPWWVKNICFFILLCHVFKMENAIKYCWLVVISGGSTLERYFCLFSPLWRRKKSFHLKREMEERVNQHLKS